MGVENCYLFEGMREEIRKKILEAGSEESFNAGDFLFHHGDPALHLYILAEGRVRLSMGPTQLLAYVAGSPGDVVGWSSLVENHAYTASAECLVAVKVLKIDKPRLDQILRDNPESGMILFKHLATLIGRRLVNSYKAALSLHGERDPRSYG